MTYIPRQTKTQKEPFTVRLDHSVVQELDRYCQFLESSRDYVIGQALTIAFRKDREYAAWLSANGTGEPIREPFNGKANGYPTTREARPFAVTADLPSHD